jgi:hypothetical protein
MPPQRDESRWTALSRWSARFCWLALSPADRRGAAGRVVVLIDPSNTSCVLPALDPHEGGDPGLHRGKTLKSLDPRLRGDDDLRGRGEPVGAELVAPNRSCRERCDESLNAQTGSCCEPGVLRARSEPVGITPPRTRRRKRRDRPTIRTDAAYTASLRFEPASRPDLRLASTNSSRSPSSTFWVSLRSMPVRRSLIRLWSST